LTQNFNEGKEKREEIMKINVIVVCCALGLLTNMAQAKVNVSVGLGGETLFVLKADSDLDKTAQQRSDDVYDRLRLILNNSRLKASDIQVKPLGNYGAKIVANGNLIVPIGKQEAEAHGSSPMVLAEEWAKNLRKVMPKLRARPDLFVMKNRYVKKRPK
jgi:hypothetical protein